MRTLTLNIYSIDDPEMQAFLAAEPAANYFTDFGAYLTERCQARGPTALLPGPVAASAGFVWQHACPWPSSSAALETKKHTREIAASSCRRALVGQ